MTESKASVRSRAMMDVRVGGLCWCVWRFPAFIPYMFNKVPTNCQG